MPSPPFDQEVQPLTELRSATTPWLVFTWMTQSLIVQADPVVIPVPRFWDAVQLLTVQPAPRVMPLPVFREELDAVIVELSPQLIPGPPFPVALRSEERRVGK